MRSMPALVALVSTFWLLGCGDGLPAPGLPDKNAAKVGPHKGTALALPDDLGYVELVNEPEVEERSGTITTSLVAYFLDQNAKESLSPAPSDAKFQVDPGSQKSRTIALKAEPKTGDSAGAARFASDPGPYRLDDLRGELTATIAGKPVKVSVVGSR